MIKKINIFVATLMFMVFTSLKAEVQLGIGLIGGKLDVSGTETEGTAADTSDRSKTFDEIFVGADLFAEKIADNGLTYGISLVPLSIDIGDGTRTDSSGGADIPSEADTGTRSASAKISFLTTAYVNVPIGSNGLYGLLGGHFTTVEIDEALPNTRYDDEQIFGAQIGIGMRGGNVKYELAYSDFEDINVTGQGGGTNSVSADADVLAFRVSFGF